MLESIKKLREMTGAGMMDVKRALEDAAGNEEQAVALLRERGIVKAAKKAGREAREGLIAIELAPDGKEAAMVEVDCETDFVARNSDFHELVSSAARLVLARRDADLDSLQSSALRPGISVERALQEAIAKIGENLVLSRAAYLQSPGVVAGYVHSNGKIGVLVALEGEGAAEVAKDIALHVTAERPRYLRREEVDQEVLAKEREILENKARNEGRPENMLERIVSGQLSKFYEENVLLEQKFVKDPSKSVAQHLGKATVGQFVRFEIGS